jgi:DNA-binding response OmpR family regulator
MPCKPDFFVMPAMSKEYIKILVVDDEEFLCQLYSQELSDEGYDVFTLTDGKHVMGAIQKYQPQLVVLDIRIGASNGLDLLQDIRNRYYNMPVVLHSAYSTYKHDWRSMAADYYVVKSADPTDLKNKIRQALECSRKHAILFGGIEDPAATCRGKITYPLGG